MPTPSERPVQAAYAGRQFLGYITVIGETFHTETPDGKSAGAFASRREATEALAKCAEASVG